MAKVVEEWKLRRNADLAKENVERSRYHDQLEWQCRFAARHLGKTETEWEELIPLMTAIEMGRLYSIDAYQMTPEELESWRDFCANR